MVGAGTVFHYGAGSVNGGGQVQNMDIVTNVAGITTGTNLSTGNAQFWGTNYTQANGYNVPNASGSTYDWGDLPQGGTYGTLQLANYGASQCLISINNWGGGGPLDIGIGNDPSPTNGGVNWTFSNNAGNYTVKNFEVLVGNPNAWTGTSTSDWGTAANWSNGVVPTAGAGFTLGGIAGGPSASTIDLGSSNQTVNYLTFQNVVPSVTISSSSGQTLILSNSSSPVPIGVSGNHFISAAVALNSTAAVTVASSSDSLTFTNGISGSGGVTLGGAGALNFTAATSYTGGTAINGGQLNLIGAASLANVSTNGVGINSGRHVRHGRRHPRHL